MWIVVDPAAFYAPKSNGCFVDSDCIFGGCLVDDICATSNALCWGSQNMAVFGSLVMHHPAGVMFLLLWIPIPTGPEVLDCIETVVLILRKQFGVSETIRTAKQAKLRALKSFRGWCDYCWNSDKVGCYRYWTCVSCVLYQQKHLMPKEHFVGVRKSLLSFSFSKVNKNIHSSLVLLSIISCPSF